MKKKKRGCYLPHTQAFRKKYSPFPRINLERLLTQLYIDASIYTVVIYYLYNDRYKYGEFKKHSDLIWYMFLFFSQFKCFIYLPVQRQRQIGDEHPTHH
jgi:hypothetical protein